jgi:hypothetical protein
LHLLERYLLHWHSQLYCRWQHLGRTSLPDLPRMHRRKLRLCPKMSRLQRDQEILGREKNGIRKGLVDVFYILYPATNCAKPPNSKAVGRSIETGFHGTNSRSIPNRMVTTAKDHKPTTQNRQVGGVWILHEFTYLGRQGCPYEEDVHFSAH